MFRKRHVSKRVHELSELKALVAVLSLLPDAEFAADDEGQLVINTGCYYGGKNGDMIFGNMDIRP
jgi:DICT domain-containing protein